MKNYVQPGNTLTLTAPYDVLSGAGFLVAGTIFAVAAADALSGAAVEGSREGVFALKKIGSQAWTVGQLVYWDNAAKQTTTVGAGNTLVGVVTEAVAGGAGDIVGNVLIGDVVLASAGGVQGVAAGYKIARGQATTATASDTIVTGLATVVSAIAVMDDAPVTGCQHASASIGNQAGAPAAGSILLQTWKATATGDAAVIAATTFSKKVNWICVGT